MTYTSSGWHRFARSGETPEQTMDRQRRIRVEAMERDRLAIIDMTLVANDMDERIIRRVFDDQNRQYRQRNQQ